MINLQARSSDDVLRRLRRIEGQVRGIQKMVTENRSSLEILQQFNAIKAALLGASQVYLRSVALSKMGFFTPEARSEIEDFLDLVEKLP